MSRIFLTGDIHNSIDIDCLNTKNFPEQRHLTKEDYVICLGDFGIPWKYSFDKEISKEDKHWLEWLETRNFTTLVVDGNHEHFNYLYDCEEIDMFGGKVGKIWNNVYHLKRGNIYTIYNKTFFIMGGATSIDKNVRMDGVSWWKEEIPSNEEFERGLNTLDSVNNSVDYILTHTAPTRVINQYMNYLRNEQMRKLKRQFPDTKGIVSEEQYDKLLDRYVDTEYFNTKKDVVADYLQILVENGIKFKKHYFGHFHDNWVSVDDKYQMIYRMVVEL